MLSVDRAIAAVLERARALPARRFALADALGLVLAEEIRADGDLPPFDKALMDGFAVRSSDLAEAGPRRLRVVDEIFAGRAPTRALGTGEAARIMTGAPLPPVADAVVMIERGDPGGGRRRDPGRSRRPGPEPADPGAGDAGGATCSSSPGLGSTPASWV